MKMSRQSQMLLISAWALAVPGACDGRDETIGAAVSTQCVDIPDGYYLFADGKFSPTSSEIALEPEPAINQRVVAQGDQINHEIAAAGFSWLTVELKGPVAVLTGKAPAPDARTAGIEAARTIIRAERRPGDPDWMIVDAVSDAEGDTPPSAALLSLTREPTPESCQFALDKIMEGRRIEFTADNTGVAPESAPVLDAVAAALRLCGNYEVEIASHTDARGAESYNLRLSQQRADAVQDYLAEKGVSSDALTARGYGESRPLDAAQTAEAYSINRRTEFTIHGN